MTFFGCSRDGKDFIFFDPWPKGSILTYKSGILGDVKSLFMGTMTFFEDEGKIRTPARHGGRHDYVVLTGP